jgi:hypothetical protein
LQKYCDKSRNIRGFQPDNTAIKALTAKTALHNPSISLYNPSNTLHNPSNSRHNPSTALHNPSTLSARLLHQQVCTVASEPKPALLLTVF